MSVDFSVLISQCVVYMVLEQHQPYGLELSSLRVPLSTWLSWAMGQIWARMYSRSAPSLVIIIPSPTRKPEALSAKPRRNT